MPMNRTLYPKNWNKIAFEDKDEAIYLKTISSYCSRKGEQITK